jgi:hypothetical protein
MATGFGKQAALPDRFPFLFGPLLLNIAVA